MNQPLSIAILDLQATTASFQDDAGLGTLASRLEAAGHRVSFTRSALSAEPAGADVWHARLGEFARAGDFDLVILARVWDGATLQALRSALRPSAKLVRFTSGVTASLDERFDHVLDAPGIARLAGGEEHPQTAAFRQVRPAELRRIARDEAPHKQPSLPVASLPGDTSLSKRPTISGPASGCPFLLDAAQNPVFAALGDRPDLQMKGCTFCLDNTGAFAVPTEQAVLDAWLGRLRALRRNAPAGKLEVLLTDERPHPFLPALFRAVIDEPSLAPIELLWKSRVDWLIEFADGPVAEAAELAAKSGSVLHLYLVGFESFDQAQLDLFNKGVTVADNVRAIEVLRDLGRRFPESFEYRRYRTHGVVLFTPWTTPESLLENARVMREVRFDELRTEAVKTRLRLYPRVPLHALAEREGLLASKFEAGRGDRAAEQGYDASAAWRFKDPRVEAIFQLATHLVSSEHTLTDADVLEIATHYVLRCPVLEAPDVGWMPFRQGLRALGLQVSAALAGLGPKAVGFDPEVELIRAGKKRACLKENVPRAQLEGLVRAYRAMGLAADVVELHGLTSGSDTHRDGDEFGIVAVAADEASLGAVLEAQRALRTSPGAAPIQAMGDLMGYPRCCVEAFLKQRSQGDNVANEQAMFLRAPTEALHACLHRTGMIRLLSHFPCTPSCEGSVAVGESVLSMIVDFDPLVESWLG